MGGRVFFSFSLFLLDVFFCFDRSEMVSEKLLLVTCYLLCLLLVTCTCYSTEN